MGKRGGYGHHYEGCVNLKTIDISPLLFGFTTCTNSMFEGCSNLEHIYSDTSLWDGDHPPKHSDMFKGCVKLHHYDGTKVDMTYAYPDNGETGYFTPKKPKITFKFADGNLGHFEYGGKTITEPVTTNYNDQITVKAVCDDEERKVRSVTDSAGNTYELDADGNFTIDCLANFTITARNSSSIQAYATITSSTDDKKDILTFRYDKDIDEYGDLAWNCENTGSSAPWGNFVGQGTAEESTVTTVVFTDEFRGSGAEKVTSCAH